MSCWGALGLTHLDQSKDDSMIRALLILALLLTATPVYAETAIREAIARIKAADLPAERTQLLAERVPNKWERRLLKGCMAFNVAGQAYDGATTAKALRSGRFREGNPALRWIGREPSRIWPVKATYAAGTTWGFIELAENHPRIAALAACASGAVSTWAGGRNRRKLQR